jgi:hypothetical protein
MKLTLINPLKLIKLLGTFKERGNLALEQILFITAIVLLSAGVAVFYDNLSGYFQSFSVSKAPTEFNDRLLTHDET